MNNEQMNLARKITEYMFFYFYSWKKTEGAREKKKKKWINEWIHK